jgi:PKHD-type hydroxylase
MDKKAIFPQDDRDMTNWYWFKSGFSNQEIDRVNESASKLSLNSAVTYGADKPNLQQRDSKVSWFTQDDPSFTWLYDKLISMAVEANKNIWNFDLNFINESIQYTQYLGGGGHFNYHLDVGAGITSRRKVSMIVQLSDPSEYEGGSFQILTGVNPQTLPNSKGAVILFPSYLLHRVTPVTSGCRRSLVLWVGGNHLR